MKQFALTLAGSLLGVAFALLLYDHFIVKPREISRAEATMVDLSATADQAKRITDGVDESVRRSVASAQQAFDAQAADQDRRRMAADALAQTQGYKVALTESFMSNGAWAAQAADAGLPPHRTNAGSAIRDIAVGAQGTITVTFDENFAPGTRLRLVPQSDPGTYQVRWRCSTTGDADLKRYLPDCSRG